MANPNIPKFRASRIPNAVTVSFTPTEETEQIIANVAAMLEGQVLARLLRRAFAEVMLPAIRTAYLQGLPKAVDMQWVKMRADKANEKYTDRPSPEVRIKQSGLVQSTPRQQENAERYTLQAAYERMRAAVLRGDPERYHQIRDTLEKHQAAYAQALQRKQNGDIKDSHKLSSGLFRTRALDVMRLFVDPAKIGASYGPDSVTVGLGPLGELNEIRTPSATEYVLHRGHTGSQYDVLWRHLEFGTGAYSKIDRPNSRYTLPGGLWYYGRRPEDAITLYGSQGVHALYDTRGVPQHVGPMLRLVAKYLGEMLSGKLRLTGA